MVTLIIGVVKDVPVPKAEPPLDAANQLIVPVLAVAPKVTVPGSQRVPGLVDVMTGVALMVATTAVLDELQLLELAST